jgi:hypothetical protein
MSNNFLLGYLVSTDPDTYTGGKKPASAFFSLSGIKDKIIADSGLMSLFSAYRIHMSKPASRMSWGRS